MRILSVSDVVEPALYQRFDALRFQGIDLVLACGDLPPEYLTFLSSTLNVPLYYVSGNHDIRHQTKAPQGCNNLHGRVLSFKNITLLGLEGSHWYNGGPFQYTEQQMRACIRRLRPSLWWHAGVDIVIAHAPPRYINDADDPCHRGFECFRWLIQKYAPSFFLHGHIHRHFANAKERITIFETTEVINTYGHYILEIDDPRLAS